MRRDHDNGQPLYPIMHSRNATAHWLTGTAKKECVSNNAICYCAHGRYIRRELIKGHAGQLWHIRARVLPEIRIRLWLKTRPRGVRMESKMLIGDWDSRNIVRLLVWKSKPYKSKSRVALLLQHQHCCSVPWHYCLKKTSANFFNETAFLGPGILPQMFGSKFTRN